jgi:hypothetical protein
MSDDLVKRLRKVDPDTPGERTRWYRNPDGPDAADRIEELESALREIADPDSWEGMDWVSYGVPKLIARAALENKMNDDPLFKLLRIRYDQIIQLHERISRLEDRIAAIQYTNLRRDMNAKNRAKIIEAICKEGTDNDR